MTADHERGERTNSTARIAVIDDDDAYRDILVDNLAKAGFIVESFDCGEAFLTALAEGACLDLALVDWRMPKLSGQEIMRTLRGWENAPAVLVLTVLGDEAYEETALDLGAVDFIDKAKGPDILEHRVHLALQMAAPAHPAPAQGKGGDSFSVGPLYVDRETSRVHWHGKEVPLTLVEFRIVDRLASRRGRDVTYREIYDQVHGEGIVAGHGNDGYRGNVRTIIKRIRKKFHEIDSNFCSIENYPGFGYRWRSLNNSANNEPPDRSASLRADEPSERRPH